MTLLIFSIYIFLLKIFEANALCVPSSSNCLTCSSAYYEQNYLQTIKLNASLKNAFLEDDCVMRLAAKNERKILILNDECPLCQSFDKTYTNLITALEEESKIATK